MVRLWDSDEPPREANHSHGDILEYMQKGREMRRQTLSTNQRALAAFDRLGTLEGFNWMYSGFGCYALGDTY